MTSLVAWTGVDSRGPASFYLASDSRISWDMTINWDFARKLFASSRYPDILGYVGDVLFSSQVLGQVMELIDSDNLFLKSDSPDSRFEAIATLIQSAFSTYPKQQRRYFAVVHVSRRADGMSTSFAMFELSWRPDMGWAKRAVQVPLGSSLVEAYGSGQQNIQDQVVR